MLLLVAVCWGLTFFSTKSLLTRLPVTDFLGFRFGVAAVILVACAPKSLRARRVVWLRGALIGCVFAAAQLTQTFGLPHTTASISGFVTGLYVLFTPLLGAVLFRVKPRPLVWVAVVLALVGLAVLATRPGQVSFGIGEWLTLVSALLWGLHITLIGRWASPGDVMSLTVISVIVGALIFLAGGLRDGLTLPSTPGDWVWMAYFAIVVGAGSEFAQFWAQARVEASRASVLMVTEPLWAAVFAVLFGGESVTWRLLMGGGLMAVGMVMAIRASPPEVPPPQSSILTAVPSASNVVPGGTSSDMSARPIGPSS